MGRQESFPSLAKMNLLNKNSLGCGPQKCFYTWTTIDLGDSIYVYYSKAIWFVLWGQLSRTEFIHSKCFANTEYCVSDLQVCILSLHIYSPFLLCPQTLIFIGHYYNKLAWGFEKVFVNKVCWGIYFNRLFPHLLSVRHQLKVFFHL